MNTYLCGDIVSRRDDPRHLGVVVAIINNAVRVRWENGWKEDVRVRADELILILHPEAYRPQGGLRPATVVESPRARLERER